MSTPQVCERVLLGDAFRIIAGVPLRGEVDDKQGVCAVRGADLSQPSLSRADLVRLRLADAVPEERFAKSGDILIQRVAASPKHRIVDTDLDGCVVGDSLLILRPQRPNVDVQIVSQYLHSAEATEALARTAFSLHGHIRITAQILSQLVVLIPPPALRDELVKSADIEGRIRSMMDLLLQKRAGLFSSSSPSQFQEHLTQFRAVREVVSSSLIQADDLTYRLRNFYPLPLAYPYRLLQAEYKPDTFLPELYRNAEGLVAFLAAIVMALAPPLPKHASNAVTKAWGGNGASFGDWLSIIQHITPLLDDTRGSLHRIMKHLWGTEETPTTLRRSFHWLKTRRDKLHHKSRDEVREKVLPAARRHFEVCLEQAEFLLQHPLRLVLDFDAVRGGTDSVRATCLDYSGDHPGCRKVDEQYSGVPKKNDLYVLQDGKEWISLFPFISIHCCPRCGARETFFVDRWKGAEKALQLKCFERGHTIPLSVDNADSVPLTCPACRTVFPPEEAGLTCPKCHKEIPGDERHVQSQSSLADEDKHLTGIIDALTNWLARRAR
jgi:hypothetical protein